ncbi:MAG: hypothetical protein M4D80_30055 [Myxococcota bacterium]|nr:hypothetical protein [Myxococcota bacterium]
MSTLAEGEAVELTGAAILLGDPLVAPFTGDRCLAHVSVARVFNRLDVAGDLIERIETFSIAPFMIETPEGPVFILDMPSIIDLETIDLVWVRGDRAIEYLAARGLAAYVRSSFFEHAVVADGEAVTVSGICTREPDPTLESSFRDLRVRTRLTGYTKHPLTLRRAR